MHNPKTMTSKTVDLPFVGRKEELENINRFYTKATDSEELQIMWISGEAGIGKSALIAAAIPEMEEAGGVVVYIKYYAAIPRSVTSLLADTINSNSVAGKVVAGTTTDDVPSLIRALRKIIRLRPTLLIFEDLHHMREKDASTLHTILHSLKHESTGIICIARPSSPPIYKVLKPYITYTIELRQLGKSALRDLLATLNLPATDHDLNILQESTKGHPLVLRSMWSELYSASRAQGKINLDTVQHLAREEVADTIEELAIYITSSLSAEEKEGVRKLATLGEVFAREAAEIVLDNNTTILTALEHAQVIRIDSLFHRPLLGKQSAHRLLTFTHSLLHQELLSDPSVPLAQLLHIIESDTGIYSLLPLHYLTTAPGDLDRDTNLEVFFTTLINNLENLPFALLRQQELSDRLWNILQRLIERFSPLLDTEQQRKIRLQTFPLRSRMTYTVSNREEWQKSIDRYLEETEAPDSEDDAEHRIQAMTHKMHYQQLYADTVPLSIFTETQSLVSRFPGLYSHPSFLRHIGYLCTPATSFGGKYLHQVRQLFDQACLVATETTLNEPLYHASAQITKGLASVVCTRDEVEELKAFIASSNRDLYNAESSVNRRLYLYGMTNAYLHIAPLTGAELIARHFHTTRPGSLVRHLLQVKIMQTRLATGTPVTEMNVEIQHYLDELTQSIPDNPSQAITLDHTMLAQGLYHSGILIGQIEWGRKTATAICNNDATQIATIYAPEVAMLEGEISTITRLYRNTPNLASITLFQESIACYVGDSDRIDVATNELRTHLAIQPASAMALLKIRIAIRFAEELSAKTGNPDILEGMLKQIQEALQNGIQWCIEEHLIGYARPLLDLAKCYCSSKEHQKLLTNISSLEKVVPTSLQNLKEYSATSTQDSRIFLRLIGTIEMQKQGSFPERFKGPRIRRTLALIAANQLMKAPLSTREFRLIATGMEPGSSNIANYMRTVLWRIRSTLGPEALIADGDSTPSFNPEHIQVDIVVIAAHLERCEDAVRKDQPRKAKEYLVNALNLTGEGPAYPSLYDEFFEAARLDFEYQIREKTLSVVTLLKRLEDYEEAIRVLRMALISLPSDDSLIEEFIACLTLAGDTQEAAHVRRNHTSQRFNP